MFDGGLPLHLRSCGEFVKLEPMQKYDIEGTAFRKGDAEKYFAYRGIEEWIRGFFTAANIFHVQNDRATSLTGLIFIS